MSMVNNKARRMKWFVMKNNPSCKRIQLADKTVYVLNTIDERPAIDPVSGCFIRYQHGNVVVNKSTMSCAWVLSVVKNVERYNQNNQLMTTSDGVSNVGSTIHDSLCHQNYHKNVMDLFHKKLSHYRK